MRECNFLWGAKTYILKKASPTYRGSVDPTTGTTLAAPNILTPLATQAENTLADNALMSQPTKFTIHWGAARYPQNGMVEGEGQHYQAESLGISSYREGAGNAESADTTRRVFSISLSSVASTGLDGMGASSRSGEGITAVFEQAGVNDIIASKVFMVLEYTQKLELRTGVVRTMD